MSSLARARPAAWLVASAAAHALAWRLAPEAPPIATRPIAPIEVALELAIEEVDARPEDTEPPADTKQPGGGAEEGGEPPPSALHEAPAVVGGAAHPRTARGDGEDFAFAFVEVMASAARSMSARGRSPYDEVPEHVPRLDTAPRSELEELGTAPGAGCAGSCRRVGASGPVLAGLGARAVPRPPPWIGTPIDICGRPETDWCRRPAGAPGWIVTLASVDPERDRRTMWRWVVRMRQELAACMADRAPPERDSEIDFLVRIDAAGIVTIPLRESKHASDRPFADCAERVIRTTYVGAGEGATHASLRFRAR
jgi:hypothetical protein